MVMMNIKKCKSNKSAEQRWRRSTPNNDNHRVASLTVIKCVRRSAPNGKSAFCLGLNVNNILPSVHNAITFGSTICAHERTKPFWFSRTSYNRPPMPLPLHIIVARMPMSFGENASHSAAMLCAYLSVYGQIENSFYIFAFSALAHSFTLFIHALLCCHFPMLWPSPPSSFVDKYCVPSNEWVRRFGRGEKTKSHHNRKQRRRAIATCLISFCCCCATESGRWTLHIAEQTLANSRYKHSLCNNALVNPEQCWFRNSTDDE